MPLPHSIHLLLNHVSDCMRRARSTAGSSRDARSPLCATGVNEPVVTTVPCCWTLELTAAASAACGPGLVLPICKCVGHFRCSQVPRESRFCQTSRVPCLGPLHGKALSHYYLGKVVKERTVPLAARCARHRRWCPRCCQHSHWSHARVGRMGRPPLRTAAKSSPGTDSLDGRASPQGWTARKIMAQLSMVPAAARFAAARSSGLSVLC